MLLGSGGGGVSANSANMRGAVSPDGGSGAWCVTFTSSATSSDYRSLKVFTIRISRLTMMSAPVGLFDIPLHHESA